MARSLPPTRKRDFMCWLRPLEALLAFGSSHCLWSLRRCFHTSFTWSCKGHCTHWTTTWSKRWSTAKRTSSTSKCGWESSKTQIGQRKSGSQPESTQKYIIWRKLHSRGEHQSTSQSPTALSTGHCEVAHCSNSHSYSEFSGETVLEIIHILWLVSFVTHAKIQIKIALLVCSSDKSFAFLFTCLDYWFGQWLLRLKEWTALLHMGLLM